ncbi:hypothetical protein LIER_31213 [Lithospermum erythrorhizon]|uniref:Uncharacterized protein n=1 Tax=Lithospermum erythrorhizon TaxID=34254 RepID=A0AAV3RTV5_LITER
MTWYFVLNHKPLWLTSNDNQRLNVKCAFSCNFSLWIAKDDKLSETDWVVKRVDRNHNYCPDVKIRLCNSTFLAKVLEGKFRLLSELDLAAVQFLFQIFKIKISRNSGRNIKEKVLRKINGDDIEQFNLCHTYCQELIKAHPGSTCFVESVEPNKPTDHGLHPSITN